MEDEALRNLGFASKQSDLGTGAVHAGAETRLVSLITGAGNCIYRLLPYVFSRIKK